MSRAVCIACQHEIDAAARLCPYCGADPRTGEKVDTQAVLQEVFQPRKVSTAEGLLEYARQRQGLVIAGAIFLGFLILGGLHQFISRRNQALSNATAVPLTDVADLNNQPDETTKPLPMPEMQFQYDGHPQTMRNFIVEPGAVPPPPEVIDQLNAQQAARRARAAAAAAAERARNAEPPAAQPTETSPQPTSQPPNR